MKHRFVYYFIRLLDCCPVMVTKDYFDWFLIHGKDLSNDIDVIKTYGFPNLNLRGSIVAAQVRVLHVPDLHVIDD